MTLPLSVAPRESAPEGVATVAAASPHHAVALPLPPAPPAPHNLPAPTSRFIGREEERALLARLLTGDGPARLVALTGPGGCGKTRLAQEAARSLVAPADGPPPFPDGVYLIELAPVADPALVPQAVATTLGVREESGRPIAETLADRLRPLRLLLVLDNCEHVIDGAAALAESLLAACPGLSVLATSRETLGLGEQAVRLSGLSLPGADTTGGAESESVRLFVDRAQAARPGFVRNERNAAAVARICRRLDGLPLAVELAAALARLLTPQQIDERLADRFKLLTGGARGALPRHQTLRAAVNWSYDLLEEEERLLLCRLSVFAGGWTLAAAEEVCADGTTVAPRDLLHLLSALVDKSLVAAEEQPDGTTRYRLLETVRQFAREKVEEDTAAADAVRTRHVAFCQGAADAFERDRRTPVQPAAVARLEREHDNLRAALDWCAQPEAHSDRHEAGLRLAGTLWSFWDTRSHLREGRDRLEAALAAAGPDAPTVLRADALTGAGVLARAAGDFAGSRPLLERAVALWREAGDEAGEATALCGLGLTAWSQRDGGTARESLARCRAIHEARGNEWGLATALDGLGVIAKDTGELDEARTLFERSRDLRRRLGDVRGEAGVTGNLGIIFWAVGDLAEARAQFEHSIELARQIGDALREANATNNLAVVLWDGGDPAAARPYLERAVAMRRRIGDRRGLVDGLVNLGSVTAETGDPAGALPLHREALALSCEIGVPGMTVHVIDEIGAALVSLGRASDGVRLWGAAMRYQEEQGWTIPTEDAARYERRRAPVRETLGEAAYEAQIAAGRALTLEEATDEAARLAAVSVGPM